MIENKIKCPKCGHEIKLTEALTAQIEENIKLKYEAEATVQYDKYQTIIHKIRCLKSLRKKQNNLQRHR